MKNSLPSAFVIFLALGIGFSQDLNTLTAKEKSEGFKLIFDGKSFEGWRGYQRTSMPTGWKILENAIARGSGGGDITTKEKFKDFEFRFDWKVASGANSGVFYRATEELGTGWQTGMEHQILDNQRHSDGRKPKTSASACYDVLPPIKDVTKPVGEYNNSRIIAFGDTIEHWLNDTKVLAYKLGSKAWLDAVANSKFRTSTKYGKSPEGHIMLQDHGDQVWFRNMKIRPLTSFPNEVPVSLESQNTRKRIRHFTVSGNGISVYLPEAGGYSLELLDARGAVSWSGNVRGPGSMQLGKESLVPGRYVLKATHGNGNWLQNMILP